jgi:hypothetical protein
MTSVYIAVIIATAISCSLGHKYTQRIVHSGIAFPVHRWIGITTLSYAVCITIGTIMGSPSL